MGKMKAFSRIRHLWNHLSEVFQECCAPFPSLLRVFGGPQRNSATDFLGEEACRRSIEGQDDAGSVAPVADSRTFLLLMMRNRCPSAPRKLPQQTSIRLWVWQHVSRRHRLFELGWSLKTDRETSCSVLCSEKWARNAWF